VNGTPETTARLRALVCAPALLAVLLAAGCHKSTPAAPEGGQSPAAQSVTVVKPAYKTLVRKVEQPGEIEADEQAPIYARIAGYVVKVNKDIGDRVEKDEVLIELSVPERDEELNQKKALVAQAGSQVEHATKVHEAATAKVKEMQSARLRVVAERRRTDSQYERLKGSRSVVPTETVDEARLSAEAARAAVGEVDAKIKSAEAEEARAKADIAVAKARLGVAKADEGQTGAMLGYAKLRAPFAGVLTRRKVDPGHLVQPAQAGARGEPLLVVSRLDPVRIYVDVPEEDADLIADGIPASVRVLALKGEVFQGKVRRSAWALDAKARTLRTQIDLPNPGGRLRPGMYAYATITVTRENVLAVPATAVQTMADHSTVCFLVREGKAARTPVRIGIKDGQSVQLMKKRKPGKDEAWEDFTGDEEVIANPPAGLTDGQAVTVAKP
jgi:RND family efflux transporter MFP subunit